MSSRYWGALFAAIGLACVAFGGGSYTGALNYPKEERYPPYRYAADSPGTTGPGIPAQPGLNAIGYREPCKEPNGQAESELCAQWRAAKAAEAGALWSQRGLWIAALGAALSFISVVLVLRALRHANEANRIAADSARRQLRAYVTFHEIDCLKDDKLKSWKLQLSWKNAGQTPAVNVRSEINWCSDERGLPEDFNFPDQGRHHLDGEAIMGPGQVIYSSCDEDMPISLVPVVAKGGVSVYIWGAINYTDAFGEERRTEWAARMKARESGGGSYGVVWTALFRYNAVDQACLKDPYPSR